jgi:hypothetical protein
MSGSFTDTLYAIFNVKMQVAFFALLLVGFATLFIKNATDSAGFAALFVPALVLGCFAGVFICKMAGVVVTGHKDANVIATASMGMLIAFIIMVGFVRAGGAVRDLSRPLDLDGRTQELD